VNYDHEMFYIKLLMGFIWFILVSLLGFFYALCRWGNTDTNHHYGSWFSWGILKIFGVEVKMEDSSYLTQHSPCVFVVNHQSNVDLITYAAICPRNTVVIGKKELIWVPFFGLFYAAAGNILLHRQVARKARAGLEQAMKKISKKKVSVWIFPEGTRNLSRQGMLPFKRGAFLMAVNCQIPIVPVVGAPLSSLIDWEKKEIRSGTYWIRVLQPISTQGMTEKEIPHLIQTTREKMLVAYDQLSRLKV
jgi:1-acyl-sn-glycerol-3-phosphate acyltransferase